jgi:MoaA/NifB/PqqE/SkfB family radical SAM enzyme
MMTDTDLLRARPQTILIEVTSKCNLRCSYCHKADDVLESLPGANDDMSDDMIVELYGYCKTAGVKNVSLSLGGETTMRAGWSRRIEQFLADPEIETHMVSNFVRLFDDDDLRALARLDQLQVSIDSADFAMMRKLRGADLRTISYNMIRLRQMGRVIGHLPFINANCTLCRDNIGHVAVLAAFCRELGVDQLLLTEAMIISQHNPRMPETLDRLTGSEIILLAEQIAAAEEALAGSSTSLRLQEHLQARVEAIIAELREGRSFPDPGTYFHRRMDSSACRQPWIMPMVRANGDVLPCCGVGEAGPVGNLFHASMHDIVDGERHRAIRASILEGQPLVSCRTCSFARDTSFSEFRREIEAWQGVSVTCEPTA